MQKFEVIANGTSFGIYHGEDKDAALLASVVDAGYESIEDAAERVGQSEEDFRATFRIIESENWSKITSYGQETRYGYGFEDEADRYCDLIDSDRVIWHATAMTDEEIDEIDLDHPSRGTEGFNLSDAITLILEDEGEAA